MPSHLTAAEAPEDLWRCRECGWTYPNHHPSAKHRRNHKKQCGKLPGFPSIIAGARTPEGSPLPSPLLVAANGSSNDASSDEEHHRSLDRQASAGEKSSPLQEVSTATPSPVSAVARSVERDSPAGTPPAGISPQVSTGGNDERRWLPRSPELLAVPNQGGTKSPARSAHEVEGKWICRQCGWAYPNSHPSAKHRRKHKKKCMAVADAGGLGGSSDDASSDEDHHHGNQNGANLPNGQLAPSRDLAKSPLSESNVSLPNAEVNGRTLPDTIAGDEQSELLDANQVQAKIDETPSLTEQLLDHGLGSAALESGTGTQVGGTESEKGLKRELCSDDSVLIKENSEKEGSAPNMATQAAVSELSQMMQVPSSGSINSAEDVAEVETAAATRNPRDSATSDESAKANDLMNLEVPVIYVNSIHDTDDIQKKLEAFPESISETAAAAGEDRAHDQTQQTDGSRYNSECPTSPETQLNPREFPSNDGGGLPEAVVHGEGRTVPPTGSEATTPAQALGETVVSNDPEVADATSSAISVNEESTDVNLSEDAAQHGSRESEINELEGASPSMEHEVTAVSNLAKDTEQQEPSASDFDKLGETLPPTGDQVTAVSLSASDFDKLGEISPPTEEQVPAISSSLGETIDTSRDFPMGSEASSTVPDIEGPVAATAEHSLQEGPSALDKGNLEETATLNADGGIPPSQSLGGAPVSSNLEIGNEATNAVLASEKSTAGSAVDHTEQQRSSASDNGEQLKESEGEQLKESALPVEEDGKPVHSQSLGETVEGKVLDESKLDKTAIPPVEDGGTAAVSQPLGETLLSSDPRMPNKATKIPDSLIGKTTAISGLEDLKQEGASASLRKDSLHEKQIPAETNAGPDVSTKVTPQRQWTPSNGPAAAPGDSPLSSARNLHVGTPRSPAAVLEAAVAQDSPGTVRSRIQAYEKMVGSIDLQQYRRKSFSPRTPGVQQYQSSPRTPGVQQYQSSPRTPGVQHYQSPRTSGVQQNQSPRTPGTSQQQILPKAGSAERSSTEKDVNESPKDIRNTISHLQHQYSSKKSSQSPSEREPELFQVMNHLRHRDEVLTQ